MISWVSKATYRDKPFVAKRYYRLDTTARTRRAVSTEANNDALRDEIICYGKATFWLGAFMDAAQSARVDIDACKSYLMTWRLRVVLCLMVSYL